LGALFFAPISFRLPPTMEGGLWVVSTKRKSSGKAAAGKRNGKRKPARRRDHKSFHLDKRAAAILEATAHADDDELMTSKKTAGEIGVSEVWLAKRRLYGNGPPYIVMSPHIIKYPRSGLRTWLEERSFTATSQYEHARPGKPLKKRAEERV
jgi:hypothetical protein